MLVFPQLTTGAISGSRLRKRIDLPMQAACAAGGEHVRIADQGRWSISWEWWSHELSETETMALARCYEEAGGDLRPLVFLDPTDNLLRWSEDLTRAPWLRAPLLEVVEATEPGQNASRETRLRNTSAVEQKITQLTGVPASAQTCLQVRVRGTGGVALSAEASGGAVTTSFAASDSWQTRWVSGPVSGSSADTTYGLSLAPGADVWIAAIHVAARPFPGAPRRSRQRSGVYPQARFQAGGLVVQATGPNRYSAHVRLTSPFR